MNSDHVPYQQHVLSSIVLLSHLVVLVVQAFLQEALPLPGSLTHSLLLFSGVADFK